MYFLFIYENKRMKLVEVVLKSRKRRGGRTNGRGKSN
jgi:hypothetical protein